MFIKKELYLNDIAPFFVSMPTFLVNIFLSKYTNLITITQNQVKICLYPTCWHFIKKHPTYTANARSFYPSKNSIHT